MKWPTRSPSPTRPLADDHVALRPWRGTDLLTLLAGAADRLVHRYRHSPPGGAPAVRAWLAAAETARRTATQLELAITTAVDDHDEALRSVSRDGTRADCAVCGLLFTEL